MHNAQKILGQNTAVIRYLTIAYDKTALCTLCTLCIILHPPSPRTTAAAAHPAVLAFGRIAIYQIAKDRRGGNAPLLIKHLYMTKVSQVSEFFSGFLPDSDTRAIVALSPGRPPDAHSCIPSVGPGDLSLASMHKAQQPARHRFLSDLA
jgi:hypothetical protein